MSANYIKRIIETFMGHDMPLQVQERFGRWLRDEESRHEKERALEVCWDELEADECPDRAQKLERLHEAMLRDERFRRRALWRRVAVAAAVLLAVGANLFVTDWYLHSHVQTNIVTTAYDKGEYVLPDGTRIWLNAGSVLRYYGDLSGRKREVELEGEAYFKVHHDKERPFILKMEDMNIEVLGTEFDAINYKDFATTETILCSGSIRAFGGNLPQAVVLKPGDRLVYNKQSHRTATSKVSTINYSQWMNGRLIFNNMSLSDILTNLQRWYAVEIDYPEQWARRVRMSFALIRNESVDEILKAVSLVVEIDYTREGRHITIKPKNKM